MEKVKEQWVGYLVNTYKHMGNYTSNRAESTHSAQKHYIRTSSGWIGVVTTKINLWARERVSDRSISTDPVLIITFIIISGHCRKTLETFSKLMKLYQKDRQYMMNGFQKRSNN